MENMKLPSKLGKEPLVDVIFELRFTASIAASDILPGALFSKLGGSAGLKVQRLPASQLPEILRKSDPLLRYSPLLNMEWGDFNLLIGDGSIAIGCKLPYPGWSRFKPAILEVVTAVMEIGIVQGVERYSLKYVDLVPTLELEAQVNALNWGLRIGTHQLKAEVAALRIEISRNDFRHLVNVQTGAVASLNDGRTLSGLALDVDTILRVSTNDMVDFLRDLPDRLDALHTSNKAVFFECLTPETIQSLEPTYD